MNVSFEKKILFKKNVVPNTIKISEKNIKYIKEKVFA